MVGEASRQANRTKIMYGLPREPDLSGFGLFDLNDDDDEGGEGDKDKPKKKRIKRDLAALRKQKNDPNAPSATRMPFPELRDVDKAEKAKALREIMRRQNLSAETLPSIIFYTGKITYTILSDSIHFYLPKVWCNLNDDWNNKKWLKVNSDQKW